MPVVRTRLYGWPPSLDEEILSSSSHFSSPVSSPVLSRRPSLDANTSPDRRSQQQRDPSWVPRPRNAFIIFRCQYSRDHAGAPSTSHQQHSEKTLSKRAAEAWKQLTAEERDHYKELANIEKEEHTRLNPNYRFRPVKRQASARRNLPVTQERKTSGSQSEETPSSVEFLYAPRVSPWTPERRFSAPDVTRPQRPLPSQQSLFVDDRAVKKARRRSSSLPLPREPAQYQYQCQPPLQSPHSLPSLSPQLHKMRPVSETFYAHDDYCTPPELYPSTRYDPQSSPQTDSTLSSLMSAFHFGSSPQDTESQFRSIQGSDPQYFMYDNVQSQKPLIEVPTADTVALGWCEQGGIGPLPFPDHPSLQEQSTISPSAIWAPASTAPCPPTFLPQQNPNLPFTSSLYTFSSSYADPSQSALWSDRDVRDSESLLNFHDVDHQHDQSSNLEQQYYPLSSCPRAIGTMPMMTANDNDGGPVASQSQHDPSVYEPPPLGFRNFTDMTSDLYVDSDGVAYYKQEGDNV